VLGQAIWVFSSGQVLLFVFYYVPLRWLWWSNRNLQFELYYSDQNSKLPGSFFLDPNWLSVYLVY
jgi:hypothetical protein